MERGITYKKDVEGNSFNYSNKFLLIHKKRTFITECDLCNNGNILTTDVSV